MKSLVVVGTLAEMGGAERQALYLVEHLAGLSGSVVEILAFEDGEALRPRLDALGVQVHVIPYYFRWPRARRARALARLAAMLRFQIRPDVLLPFVGVHSKTIGLVWPYSGAKFCWWNQQDEGRDLAGTSAERRILQNVSCIISNSVAGRDFLAGTYGLERESILVYNNGTPVPVLKSVPQTWTAMPDLRGRQIVTMIANVTSYKDHSTLLHAWGLVKRYFDGRTLPALLLAGHLHEAKTVSHLKLTAFDLGLSSDDVRFLGTVSDVDSLILASDLIVHSSVTEGCPNAVCEAMSFARPVVATDIPGCRQALGDDSAAWLAAPGDPAALASAIMRALADDTLRAEAGCRNRRRIEEHFSIAAMNRFFQGRIEAGLGRALS